MIKSLVLILEIIKLKKKLKIPTLVKLTGLPQSHYYPLYSEIFRRSPVTLTELVLQNLFSDENFTIIDKKQKIKKKVKNSHFGEINSPPTLSLLLL